MRIITSMAHTEVQEMAGIEAQRRDAWRPLVGAAGVLLLVGGAMHPQGDDVGNFKEELVTMMDDPSWVPGHALMALSSLLLLVALLRIRRSGAWDAAGRPLPLAVLATAVNTVELVLHTLAVVDKDQLAAGGMPPVTFAHLTMAVIAYPLFGFTMAALAWRLASSWPLPLRAISAAAVIGGIANGFAAPLTVLLREPAFSVLFMGAVPISFWLITMGVAGLREPADVRVAVA